MATRQKKGWSADSKLRATELKTMYRRMATARLIEELMSVHTSKHKFSGWWHSGWGQEGAPIGATAAMRTDDYLFYQGRGTAWAIGKGMGPLPILGDLLGKVNGSTGGRGGGIPHWCDPDLGVMGEGATLGSVFPVAAGAAFAAQLRGTDQVALADFGDGTSARGTFHETMVQAATWKLPMVFFCENNGLIVSMRLKDVAPTTNIADYAAGYGVPGVIVDGQDAVAVYEATQEAFARARAGNGPTLIEAKVVRHRGHWDGDPQLYRTDKDDDLVNYRDPLDVLRQYMSAEDAAEAAAQAQSDVDAAYEQAMAAPEADASILWKDIYA